MDVRPWLKQPSAGGHLRRGPLWVVTHKAALNTRVWAAVWTDVCISVDECPGVPFPGLERNCRTLLQNGCLRPSALARRACAHSFPARTLASPQVS